MNGKRTDANYRPVPNVIKGIVPKGGGCCIGNSEKVSPDTLGLPRDDCFTTGTCTRFGNGVWSTGRAAYETKNYGSTSPTVPAGATRYAYDLAEIARAGGAASTGPPRPIRNAAWSSPPGSTAPPIRSAARRATFPSRSSSASS